MYKQYEMKLKCILTIIQLCNLIRNFKVLEACKSNFQFKSMIMKCIVQHALQTRIASLKPFKSPNQIID